MDQGSHEVEVRRYVGVASTVIGLICYALSSSFNNLFGKWNALKIFAYCVSSSMLCLAILFPKAWQHSKILRYRGHFAFLVSTSTTVYSFYLDRKSKTKPDAYAVVSYASFATTSLCMSKRVICGLSDLMNFFCALVLLQLMQIKILLVFAGIGFWYLLFILSSYLEASSQSGSQSQSQSQTHELQQVAIDIPFLLQSWFSGHVGNQMIVDTDSLRSTSSRASVVDIIPQDGSILNHTIAQVDSHSVYEELEPLLPRLDIISLSLSSLHLQYELEKLLTRIRVTRRTRIFLDGDWICTYHASVREMFERYQRRLWTELLKGHNESRDRMTQKLDVFNSEFKDMCTLLSNWFVPHHQQLRDDLRTSLVNTLLVPYVNFISRFNSVLPNKHIEYVKSDVQAEIKRLFTGTTGENGKKLKLE